MHRPTQLHGFSETPAMDAMELKEESFCQVSTHCSQIHGNVPSEKHNNAHRVSSRHTQFWAVHVGDGSAAWSMRCSI